MKLKYNITGMTCASCSSSIQAKVSEVHGVQSVSVNLTQEAMQVECSSTQVAEAVVNQVRRLGYGIQQKTQANVVNSATVRQTRIQLIATAVLAVVLSIIHMTTVTYPWLYVQAILATVILYVGGKGFYTSALAKLRHGVLNMDTLIVLSVSVAYGYSMYLLLGTDASRDFHFESVGMVLTFILVGKYIEHRAKLKTALSIQKLEKIQPQSARVWYEGQWQDKPISEIVIGDRVQVFAQSLVTVDGVVHSGHTSIDESMMTGEPMPVAKQPGDHVYAGTQNIDQNIEIQVTKTNQKTVISQIIERIDDAQLAPPKIQKTVDRIASIFVPIVILLALVGGAIWWLSALPNASQMALQVIMTVLIIACPCALGLATPTAIAIAIGRAARHGMLVKDIDALERFRHIDTIVLDKTNTLTKGKPDVKQIQVFQEHPLHLQILYGLALSSSHPLSQGIAQYLADQNIQPKKPQISAPHAGKGIAARIDQMNALLGSQTFLNAYGVEITEQGSIYSTVHLSVDNQHILTVELYDPPKPQLSETLSELRHKKLDIHLLSGDKEAVVNQLANQLHIAHVRAEVLPHQKGQYIEELQAQKRVVCMVGDGINDAEALAKSDLGIAMAHGSELAIHAADIALIHSRLETIPQAIRLAEQTRLSINQNLFWAFIYNLIMIPIAMGALYPVTGFVMTPMLAAIAMTASSISVVLNSLRYRYK